MMYFELIRKIKNIEKVFIYGLIDEKYWLFSISFWNFVFFSILIIEIKSKKSQIIKNQNQNDGKASLYFAIANVLWIKV